MSRFYADHDTGTVVDKKMIPNFSAGMDVDTRKAMGVFGSSSGNRSAALNNKVSVQVGNMNALLTLQAQDYSAVTCSNVVPV
jgi:hypothetical protein